MVCKRVRARGAWMDKPENGVGVWAAWPSTCLPARAENTAAAMVNSLALAELLRLSLEEAVSLTAVAEDMAKAAVEVLLDSSLEVF